MNHESPLETASRPVEALDALEIAALRAEGKATGPLVAIPSGLFTATAESYRADVRRALDRVMMAPDPEVGLDALLESGALTTLLPEVHAMVGFGDGEWRHKDVWKHTKQVVRQATPRIEVRWAALLHDIGKVKTRSISPSGEVHFFGHAEVGARMFDKMEKRTHLFQSEESLRSSVRFLILHHLRAGQYDGSWTDNAVRRFAKEMGPNLDDLLCLSRADITTKRPEKKRRGLSQIEELAARIEEVRKADSIVPPLPKGIGDAITAAFGIPPSKRIGDIKKLLEDAVDRGELEGHQPIEFYVEFLRNNPSAFGL